MKSSDIKRVVDEGLADVKMTEQSMDAVMRRIREAENAGPAASPKTRGRRVARRIIIAAICAILMLSVVSMALGVPIWEMLVVWTKEHLSIDVSHKGSVEEQVSREGFSEDERQTWGEKVCAAFEDMGVYPALPTWKPEGYDLYSILNMSDETGYAYADALYHDKDGKTLKLLLEILPSNPYEYGISIERDEAQSRVFTIDGTRYFLVSNLDTNTAAWMYGNVSYRLSGHQSFDTLEKMIRSIQYS